MIDRYLSIWEIAHRWRDVNPDKSDSAGLPLNIQDTIRYICRGVLGGGISLFQLAIEQAEPLKNGSTFRSEVRLYIVGEFPNELEGALTRKYNKEALNSYYIEAENLFDYCLYNQVEKSTTGNCYVDFPACWSHLNGYASSSDSEQEDCEPPKISTQPLRPSQVDKLICQAIAKTLWDEYPQMTIAAMTEHKAILEYGGGKLYSGKNTLRDWLSEVAPPDVKKPGRPKSIKPNKDVA